MAPGAERSAQCDGRAWRERHEHDADVSGSGQVEHAGHHPRKCRNGDQYREHAFEHQAGPLRDPTESAGHDGEPEIEHHSEERRDGDDGKQPLRYRPAQRHCPILAKEDSGGLRPRLRPYPKCMVEHTSARPFQYMPSNRNRRFSSAVVPHLENSIITAGREPSPSTRSMVEHSISGEYFLSSSLISPSLVPGSIKSRNCKKYSPEIE